MGWLARKLGLQTNSVTAIELVTADGRLVRADEHHHADLFWAARGGGGNFGIVTAIEFRLYEIPSIVGGAMIWPAERSREVLHAWREWAETAPDEVTTSARIMNIPDMEGVPDMVRGRSLVVIDGAVIGIARGGRRDPRAAPRARARDRHVRPRPADRAELHPHGPGGAGPGRLRDRDARRRHAGARSTCSSTGSRPARCC